MKKHKGKLTKGHFRCKNCQAIISNFYKDKACPNCLEIAMIKTHLEHDIKESEKSIKEDKELKKTLGRMM